MMYIDSLSTPKPPIQPKGEKLWSSAQTLEAIFLSEMLKHSGFGKPLDSFGGGIGEEQFSSLLVEHQAQALAKNGGIGLAEQIFRSLVGKNA